MLLDYGANVTLTDDRGLTPLDFAKSRKMKNKLREAWTEVINRKSVTSLGPVRAPSKEDLRASLEDLSKKKKGEVIFDVSTLEHRYNAATRNQGGPHIRVPSS